MCNALTFVVADDRQRATAVKNGALRACLLGLRAHSGDRECLRVRRRPSCRPRPATSREPCVRARAAW